MARNRGRARGAPTSTLRGSPASRWSWSSNEMIEQVHLIGARGRVGAAVAARLAERGVALRSRRSRPRPAVRPRPRDPRGRRDDPAGPVGRPRERRDAARRPRPARAAVLRCTRCRRSRSSEVPSSWTAPGGRSPPRAPRRMAVATELAALLGLRPFDARRRRTGALPRRRGDGRELPRHPAAGRRRSSSRSPARRPRRSSR